MLWDSNSTTRKITAKYHKYVEAKQCVTKQWIIEEIKKKKKKKPGEEWNNDPKSMGCSKNSPKKEVYSNTNLPQETRNTSNNITL